MVGALKRMAYFMRFTDEQGKLSITNCGCHVSLIKLAMVSHPSYAEVGTFLLAAAAYNFKKYLEKE